MTAQTMVRPLVAETTKVAIGRGRRKLTPRRQIVLQLICLAITATVVFPLMWVVSMALDPRNLSRPDRPDAHPAGGLTRRVRAR